MKKVKELVKQRTRFLRSEWKDWEGGRLDGEETWKGLEKTGGQREDLGPGWPPGIEECTYGGCNLLKVANGMHPPHLWWTVGTQLSQESYAACRVICSLRKSQAQMDKVTLVFLLGPD